MPTTADSRPDVSASRVADAPIAIRDSRLRILYLLAIGLVVFVASSPVVLLGLSILQPLLWWRSGYPLLELRRPLRRLLPFAGLLLGFAALFGHDRGALLRDGLAPALRLLVMVLASQWVQRTVTGEELVRGLTRLGFPLAAAVALENTLALITGSEASDGRGGLRLGRRVLVQAVRGEVGFLVEALRGAVARARVRMEPFRERLGSTRLDDLAVVCGVALVSAAVRFLRIAPGLPIAPGHKTVVLIPLYVVAAALTGSRWGATQAGTVMGLTALLMGDGRFGILELPKYLAPGLVVDALLPRLAPSGNAGWARYALLGLLAGLARFSTMLVVALFVGAPAGLFVALAPVGIAHAVFGAVSGFVTVPLVKALGSTRPRGLGTAAEGVPS